MRDACNEATAWLNARITEQESLPLTADPVLRVEDINCRRQVRAVYRPFFRTGAALHRMLCLFGGSLTTELGEHLQAHHEQAQAHP